MIYHKGFQSLLYYKLIQSKRFRVDETADKMGISPATLYGYAEARSTFPVDLLGKLYNATKDPEFLTFVIDDTDCMAVPRPQAEAKGRSLVWEAADVSMIGGELLKQIDEALSDGRIDEPERKRLNQLANRGLKEFQDVINHLEQDSGKEAEA